MGAAIRARVAWPPFAIWKRELPQRGSITLGPARDTPDQRLLWMYGIAAKVL